MCVIPPPTLLYMFIRQVSTTVCIGYNLAIVFYNGLVNITVLSSIPEVVSLRRGYVEH